MLDVRCDILKLHDLGMKVYELADEIWCKHKFENKW